VLERSARPLDGRATPANSTVNIVGGHDGGWQRPVRAGYARPHRGEHSIYPAECGIRQRCERTLLEHHFAASPLPVRLP